MYESEAESNPVSTVEAGEPVVVALIVGTSKPTSLAMVCKSLRIASNSSILIASVDG